MSVSSVLKVLAQKSNQHSTQKRDEMMLVIPTISSNILWQGFYLNQIGFLSRQWGTP